MYSNCRRFKDFAIRSIRNNDINNWISQIMELILENRGYTVSKTNPGNIQNF